jgi:hypothetical protein
MPACNMCIKIAEILFILYISRRQLQKSITSFIYIDKRLKKTKQNYCEVSVVDEKV